MKKVLALLFSLWSSVACAGVSCSVPFNLQNNTIADATQVMANYNALVACLGNAASAGANNDITQLLGLSSPLSPTFGGANTFYGGTSSGGGNAQVITVVPSTFSLTIGYIVSYQANLSNSGPMTLNVNGTGVLNVFRMTQNGLAPTVGGEIIGFQRVLVAYDGFEWQLIGRPPVVVGTIFDYAGTSCPIGTFNTNSQTVSRTTFGSLFTSIGTTWGIGDGSTTFTLPDLRNRATYGQDTNIGGLSNRITVAGSNFDGTVVGNAGGLQNSNSVGAHVHTDSGHTHAIVGSDGNGGNVTGQTGTIRSPGANAGGVFTTLSIATASAVITSTGGTYSVLAPAAIVSKCIQG
jgi:microcystin-dependent protein